MYFLFRFYENLNALKQNNKWMDGNWENIISGLILDWIEIWKYPNQKFQLYMKFLRVF